MSVMAVGPAHKAHTAALSAACACQRPTPLSNVMSNDEDGGKLQTQHHQLVQWVNQSPNPLELPSNHPTPLPTPPLINPSECPAVGTES